MLITTALFMLKPVGQRWLKTIPLDTFMFKYWLLQQLLKFSVMQRTHCYGKEMGLYQS